MLFGVYLLFFTANEGIGIIVAIVGFVLFPSGGSFHSRSRKRSRAKSSDYDDDDNDESVNGVDSDSDGGDD
ncbi:hypothetical protein [Bacillus sp. T3]|uniref:hypothetical protein n=1 Tax=Bacillus sp. T3 TaxID=467262 RepID=UPI002982AEF5|nr:hypothetical protein [Bacillus sp. T3]